MSITVPWNASWTDELSFEVRPCRWADGKLAIWQPHRPGEGQPIYAKPHLVRQRRSVARFICTVCGEHTPHHDRWWFGLGRFADGYFMTTEAPVHSECGKLSSRVCPRLRALKPDMRPFPAESYVLSAIVGGASTDEDYGVRIAGRTVIGHLKFAWPERALLRSILIDISKPFSIADHGQRLDVP